MATPDEIIRAYSDRSVAGAVERWKLHTLAIKLQYTRQAFSRSPYWKSSLDQTEGWSTHLIAADSALLADAYVETLLKDDSNERTSTIPTISTEALPTPSGYL